MSGKNSIRQMVTEKKQKKPNDKFKDKKESLQSYDKLIELLREKRITEEDAILTFSLSEIEPAKDFYRTIVSASQQINEKIRDKTLDLDNDYQRSLLRMLEVGEKISKTLTVAKLEAYPDINSASEDKSMSYSDRKAAAKNGNITRD